MALAAVDGQPAYRGKQLMDGVLHGARSVDDIRNVRIWPDACRDSCWFLSVKLAKVSQHFGLQQTAR